MGKIERRKDEIEWEQGLFTGEGLDDVDLLQQKEWQREQWDLFFKRVAIKRRDRAKTKLDAIRGEPAAVWGKRGRKRPADKGARFKPPITYPAYVDHQPRQSVLIKYGIDHPRDAAFTFLDFVLAEDKVSVEIGDLIEFQGEEFEVKDVYAQTEAYWVNTEFKFYLLATADRYRPEGDRKVDYGGK